MHFMNTHNRFLMQFPLVISAFVPVGIAKKVEHNVEYLTVSAENETVVSVATGEKVKLLEIWRERRVVGLFVSSPFNTISSQF